MGRNAKSTRGGNKRRVNPGRLKQKFAKQGLSEHAAEVAARAATKLAATSNKLLNETASRVPKPTTTPAAVSGAKAGPVPDGWKQAPRPTTLKSSIAAALASLQQQRNLTEQRTVVKQAQRRR